MIASDQVRPAPLIGPCSQEKPLECLVWINYAVSVRPEGVIKGWTNTMLFLERR